MLNKKLKNKGFTLVEMLIAISLFSTVVFISLGALLSVFDANRVARSSKTVVDNLNLAVENMARTIRFGDTYHCDSSNGNGGLDSVANCPGSGGARLAVQFQGNTIVYRKCGTSINRSILGEGKCGDDSMIPITSPETVIEELTFRTFGTAADNVQPYVIVLIKGYVGKPTAQSSFVIETMMSQRKLDI